MGDHRTRLDQPAADAAGAGDRLDARPAHRVSEHSAWSSAIAVRDSHVGTILNALEAEGIDALVLASQHGIFPPWVRLEAWLPAAGAEGARSRCQLEIVVDVRPFHERTLVVTARATRGPRTLSVAERPEFSSRDAKEWTLYALGRGPTPSSYTPVADAVRSLLAGIVPFLHGPHHNPIHDRWRNALSLTGARVLAMGGGILMLMGGSLAAGAEDGASVALVAGLGAMAAAALVVRARRLSVSTPAQPPVPPRLPGLVDSWHTVVSGLGRDQAGLVERIRDRLTGGAAGLRCQVETYSYRTPNGYEQRERLVVSRRQGMVHVHVYRFGEDAFVGWHAYLNWARWAETGAVSRRVADGVETEFRDLRPGLYVPGQFDLIDVNSLSEFVHRQVQGEIARSLREREIDQQIDFRVIRGDRERALDRTRHGGDLAARPAPSRLARVAARWHPRSETEVVRPAAAGSDAAAGAPARRFGAALVLPVLTAVGWYTLRLVDTGAWTYEVDVGVPHVIAPLAHAVPALVVAFGLWSYARLSLGRSLLVAALAVVLAVVSRLLLNVALVELAIGGVDLAAVAAAAALSAGSVLLPAAALEPELRAGKLWLVFLGLWAGGTTAVYAAEPAYWTYPVLLVMAQAVAMGVLGHRLQAMAAERAR
jgi:hypothetical protein